MAVDYVTQIRSEIAFHQNELAKLSVALEVMERLQADKKEERESYKTKALEKPKEQQPMFTVRRKKQVAGHIDPVVESRDHGAEVIKMLKRERVPMASGEIIRALGYNDHKTYKQRVYAAINRLVTTGVIIKRDDFKHVLVDADLGRGDAETEVEPVRHDGGEGSVPNVMVEEAA